MIAESGFTSLPDMAAEVYPFLPARWLARIRYDNLTKIARLGVPLFLIRSPEDEIVPLAHAHRLFAAAESLALRAISRKAELLQRVFEIDALRCSYCGAVMRFDATNAEPVAIEAHDRRWATSPRFFDRDCDSRGVERRAVHTQGVERGTKWAQPSALRPIR